MSTRDSYLEKLKTQLTEWNTELEKLEAKVSRARAEGQIKVKEQLSVLPARRDEAMKKLSEIQETGEDAWEELKDGAEKAWSALKVGFEKARAKARKSPSHRDRRSTTKRGRRSKKK